MEIRFPAPDEPITRVDGRLKVTGAAKYAAEYELPNTKYAVLVTSTIAKGQIQSINTKAAAQAPGVIAVVSHLNALRPPGYPADNEHPTEPPTGGIPLRPFHSNKIYFNGQPVAMVVADTFERATYAASLVKLQYAKETHATDIYQHLDKAVLPASAAKNPKSPLADYDRGEVDGYKKAPVQIEAEYEHPAEMHNPMELQAITAHWEAEDKLTIYDKVQGTQPTQLNFAKEWKLQPENVKVIAKFVGGAFGNGLHNWPHETAAIMAAKMVKNPVKLMLTREQMFFMVGYRPKTLQKIALGATKDGKLVGITHSSVGQTSSYEEFTESTLQQSRMMYAAPNVSTRYRILPLDVSTPIWMRGPGEATGAFALECAMDELAFELNIDPLQFRVINHTDSDPEKKLPWSTKYLKECFDMGAKAIGWNKRQLKPATLKDGPWQIGYGMAVGTFGANRRGAKVRATLLKDGRLLLQSAVTDIGPGTGTAMTQIATEAFGIAPENIVFDLGNSSFPEAGNQGGSSTVNSVGPAVVAACKALQLKLLQLASSNIPDFKDKTIDQVTFEKGNLQLKGKSTKISFKELIDQKDAATYDVLAEAKPGEERKNFSMYSYSVHFAEVHVHAATGMVKVKNVVTCADAGTIINQITASSQMIGGVTGGIGMALHEAAVMDHRYGRYITKDLADYHVPVHADVPKVEVLFVNKPDFKVDPLGTKGIGEIAIIGVAPAILNAIFNATGKRIRQLPVTPDKLI
ncbi:xanthine dehydrogenase family protein molybdopterin-binding subunit [Pedobacter sp.]|uniref:xanthine dehydrogenase family protein molybdopterin-binding subunit n=1 Tax=Pedobacter sp. TaxID=1411316 RepID=UPI003D7FCA93